MILLFAINGNGHTIKVSNPNERAENHFLTCGNKSNVIIKDLKLSGFNTAIINQGTLNLTDVTFEGNRLNYWICEDYGGAIKSNGGLLSCTDCTFINNYAKKGGAIYLGRNAEANIKDCHFEENNCYSYGSDIYHDCPYEKLHIINWFDGLFIINWFKPKIKINNYFKHKDIYMY